MTQIYGMLICQNGISEIQRCVESVSHVVEKYFVMDGGSTDGTWEWLNKYKDVYNLSLYQQIYEDQGAQRNKVLAHIPKNSWVVNIDQDEALNYAIIKGLLGFIERIYFELYTKRDLPLTLEVKNVDIAYDIYHYKEPIHYFASKIFYNDNQLHFTPGYHTSICYFDTENNTNVLKTPFDWAIKHYAYVDKARLKSFRDPKRSYKSDEWDTKLWSIKEFPISWI